MKNNLIIISALMFFLLSSCNSKKQVVNPKDYIAFLDTDLPNTKLISIDSEMIFWQKRVLKDTGDFVSKMRCASLLVQRFAYSGNINELHIADSIYKKLTPLVSIKSSGIYRTRATLAITQHQFAEAEKMLNTALAMGDDKYVSTLMAFDAAMELGKTEAAADLLASVKDKESFEYLIRKAKYEDHVNGNLDAAIELMEKALIKVTDETGSLYLWTKSNLADMYSHHGNAEKSYKYYIDVLKADPQYFHALKGIAWLAFSKDKNTIEAKKILTYLKKVNPVPDYDLLLSDIAGFENNEMAKEKYIHQFISAVQNPLYGNMYNKYLFNLYADEMNNLPLAAKIAQTEVMNRPTAEAESWLAWYYHLAERNDSALLIVKSRVENQSYEPDVMYRMGKIFAGAGEVKKARRYLSMASASSLEVGPVKLNEILTSLRNL